MVFAAGRPETARLLVILLCVGLSQMRPSIVEASSPTADRRGRGAETESEAAALRRTTGATKTSYTNDVWKSGGRAREELELQQQQRECGRGRITPQYLYDYPMFHRDLNVGLPGQQHSAAECPAKWWGGKFQAIKKDAKEFESMSKNFPC